MHSETGEILGMDEVKRLTPEEQKKFIQIPLEEEKEVFAMNRHDRRKWAKLNRR